MTKHSIDIALKIPFLLKSASFRSEYSANEYVIYKDEITVKAVQSPLFSYVISAKVVKIIEKSWHTIKKSCRVITTGQDKVN